MSKGTLLQSLAQRQDGLVLLESFESANFITDQAWVTLNGNPTQDNTVAKDGLFSLKLDSSCPLIQNTPGPYVKYAACWFYDVATNITSQSVPAMLLTDTATGNTVAIGVNNALDPNHYCIQLASGAWQPTIVPRSTGFHR